VVATGDPAEENGERGGVDLLFHKAPPETRAYISAYVSERLGLPPLP
jgi:hypothetical protein